MTNNSQKMFPSDFLSNYELSRVRMNNGYFDRSNRKSQRKMVTMFYLFTHNFIKKVLLKPWKWPNYFGAKQGNMDVQRLRKELESSNVLLNIKVVASVI